MTFPLPTPCSATTRAGHPCGFAARKATGLCVNHDPAYQAQQRQNTMKGVAHSLRTRQAPRLALDSFDLSHRAGIQAALDAVIRLELAGRLPRDRARNLIRALSIASRNFDRRFIPHEGRVSRHDRAPYAALRANLDRHLPAILAFAEAQDTAR